MSEAGEVKQVPTHHRCTYILPSNMAAHVAAKDIASLPKWMTSRTHGCWCSSWKLTGDGWRVWRKGRWLRPKPRELQMRWVIEKDGHRVPITAKEAKMIARKNNEQST